MAGGLPFPGTAPIGIAPNDADWVAGSFGTGGGTDSPDGASTNAYMLGVLGDTVPNVGTLTGSIGGYAKNAGIYHCPADHSVNAVTQQLRIRSSSANGYVGTTLYEAKAHGNEINALYKTFRKTTDFIGLGSSDAFVFVDENPASLNDGFLRVVADCSSYGDMPAVNHGASSSFSFADGHAQLQKWRDAFVNGSLNPPSSLLKGMDNTWLTSHATVLR
jgi:prepilin-type processing-associated H-X9-DG protein